MSHVRILHARRRFGVAFVVGLAVLALGFLLRESFAGRLMVDPVALELGPIAIRWYGILIAVGVGVGVPWTVRRYGSPEVVSRVEGVLWLAVLGGVVGARLAYVGQNLPEYLAQPATILALSSGGLSIHGMILGGTLTAAIAAKAARLDFWRLADAAVPAVLLGMILGRFGNFTNGELIGTGTTLPWRMLVVGADGLVGVHPIFLYDALLNSCLLAYLLATEHAFTVRGVLFGRFLLGISVTRFIVEFFRLNDPPSTDRLSLAQYVSLGLLLASLGLLLSLQRGRRVG